MMMKKVGTMVFKPVFTANVYSRRLSNPHIDIIVGRYFFKILYKVGIIYGK